MNYPASQDIAKRSGSSFYSSFFFLPRKQRQAMMVLYALSRLLDDVVDGTGDLQKAHVELNRWRQWIEELYRGVQTNHPPVLVEYGDVVRQFGLKKEYLLDLLSGMEMDLEKRDYQTFGELEKYCYHAAGTVGLLCNQIFGFNDPRAYRYAVLLGTAFQLTNILRDVGADRLRGRIYLPQEDRDRFGYTREDLMAGRRGGGFLPLMRFEAARAENYFQKASSCLTLDERGRLAAATVMARSYYRLLQTLKKRDFPVFEGKVSLSRWNKIKILVSTYLQQ